MSKFSGIVYPFFALKKKPFGVVYDINTICVRRLSNGHLETLDDKRLTGDYFSRLLQMNHRVTFDYTCKDLQELIRSNAKWGVDRYARPFDLSKKASHPIKIDKVTKVLGDLIWLRTVTYPFELRMPKTLEFKDDLYAIIVNVDNEWFIKEFVYEPKLLQKFAMI